MKHRFHPEARHEYGEQVQHYEGRRRGLGAEFITEVERTVARICLHPERYRVEDSCGVELLASMHWAMCHDVAARDNADVAVPVVHPGELAQKQSLEALKPEHLKTARRRLQDAGWDVESRSAIR